MKSSIGEVKPISIIGSILLFGLLASFIYTRFTFVREPSPEQFLNDRIESLEHELKQSADQTARLNRQLSEIERRVLDLEKSLAKQEKGRVDPRTRE